MAKILLVDDSSTMRSLLKKYLLPAGHEILEAKDGKDGFDKWKNIYENQGRLDLVITDINMPGMDGLKMCEKIHLELPQFKVPILILSTESSPDLKMKGKQVGVIAWMLKPPQPHKVVETIEKILIAIKA